MKKKKVTPWKLGDIFLVSQSDHMSTLGQIVAIEPTAMNSLAASFYDARFPQETVDIRVLPAKEKIFSVKLVTRDLLDEGVWRIVGNASPIGVELFKDLAIWRANRFIGARINGSGVIADFISAFYGLAPWDGMKNPQFYDEMLLDPGKKPTNLVYKKVVQ
jgi:hypothetical protein